MFNEDGSVNEACTRARAIYGLPAIEITAENFMQPQTNSTPPQHHC